MDTQMLNADTLDFSTYCIGNLSRRLGLTQSETYRRLKTAGLIDGYVVPAYDVLHTFGKEYIMDDLTDMMRRKGVLEP